MTAKGGRNAVVSTVERVTPAMAAKYLSHMVANRAVRAAKVEQYARDMAAGRWSLNGEAVIFGSNDVLLDGQHRMRAVIKANVSVDMLIVRGVDPSGFITIDTGATRDFGDVLTIEGEASAKLAASVARLWCLYEQDAVHRKVTPTTTERQIVFSAHRTAIEKGVALGWRFKQARKLVGISNVAFFGAYVSEKIDEETAFLFLESIDKGDGLVEGDAVYALRRLMVNNLSSTRRLRGEQVLALMIKAFAYWHRNRKVKVLVWREDEQFPRFPVE